MKNSLKCFFNRHGDTILVELFMLGVFSYIMFFAHSDLQVHTKYVIYMLTDHRLFDNNFLMYLMANVLAGFSGALLPTQLALVCLIATSNTAKYVLVRNEFAKGHPLRVAKIASLALLFVFVIPVVYFSKVFGFFPSADSWYLGYYVPNVWHNSTILCMMPFAIITFFLSVRQFDCYDGQRNGLISLFVVLGALVKPSFFFIYAVAYPICMFVKYRFRKEFFYSLIPILAGCVCLLYEYQTIYDGDDDCRVLIDVSHIFTIGFWKSTQIVYFAASVLFPIIFVVFYWKEIHKDIVFWFVLLMLVVAVGMWWCCKETGYRADDGNFYWQVVPAMWLTYYYILKTILLDCEILRKDSTLHLQKENVNHMSMRNKIFVFLYLLHVVMGVAYLGRYLVANNYF